MEYLKVIIAIIYFNSIVGCKEKSEIPAFYIRLADSTTILVNERIPAGRPVMLIYFSPDCDHCQKETEEVLQNMERLKGIQMYFITVENFGRMKVFNNFYHLNNYPNIVIGQDYNFSLLKFFNLPTTPCILLYNKHKKLKMIWKGYFPIQKIVEGVDEL